MSFFLISDPQTYHHHYLFYLCKFYLFVFLSHPIHKLDKQHIFIQPPDINPSIIISYIPIQSRITTSKPNRVLAYICPCLRTIIPKPIISKFSFKIIIQKILIPLLSNTIIEGTQVLNYKLAPAGGYFLSLLL